MLMSSRLDGFSEVDNGVYNFRCPFCGDSKKKISKKRGYIFSTDNKARFFCHNCGIPMNLKKFVETVAPDLYLDYKMDKFKESTDVTFNIPKKEVEISIDGANPSAKFAKIKSDPLASCYPLINVPQHLNDILEYAKFRMIPERFYPEIFVVESIKMIVDKIPKYYGRAYPDIKCLVFPFYKKNGEYDFIQCRNIDSSKRSDRFFTLETVTDDGVKIFGENRLDFNSPIYVLEGPLDSLYINNGCATAGAASSIRYLVDKIKETGNSTRNICFVFDSDYTKNPEIMKQVEKTIKNECSVVLYDYRFDGLKDINDAIKAGWSEEEINAYIRDRTFYGLKASLELAKIKRRL